MMAVAIKGWAVEALEVEAKAEAPVGAAAGRGARA